MMVKIVVILDYSQTYTYHKINAFIIFILFLKCQVPKLFEDQNRIQLKAHQENLLI
ncbi:hypothetical protein HanIR_Chr15g0750831 [Helianthus annuus]|nr:hypothetical protein HanIR_Chr15g0750831 [Helianthus annuus]